MVKKKGGIMSKEIKITDIDKLKNLLIKLDLKYHATKDQINANGVMALMDFDREYKEFNTINALDVINDMYERLLTLSDEKIKLLEHVTTMSEDITIKEEKDTKYGTAITRKKLGVVRVSEIDRLIEQLKGRA